MPKDLPLLQRRLVCERASLWAKPRVRQPLKAKQRCQLPRLSSGLSYPPVSLALVRPDWATDLAQYKLQRIRLHDDHRKQTAESQTTHSQREPFGSDRVDQLFVVDSDERMCCTRVAGPSSHAREIAAPGLS